MTSCKSVFTICLCAAQRLPFSAFFKNKGTLNFLVCKYIQYITLNFCPFPKNYKKKALSPIFLLKSVPLNLFSHQKGTFIKFNMSFTYRRSHLQKIIISFNAPNLCTILFRNHIMLFVSFHALLKIMPSPSVHDSR